MKIIYLMGGTCCGKSTFLESAREFYKERAGFVEVGKAKYSPDYFKGSAAPDHTEREAIALYQGGVSVCVADKREFCFVDGQPRRPSQVDAILHTYPTVPKQFLLFTASADQQAKRAARRFAKDPESLKLAIARIDNDRKQGYDTLCHLLHHKCRVDCVTNSELDKADTAANWSALVFHLVRELIETKPGGLTYLASPYSHNNASVELARFHSVNRVAAELMRKGLNIFSPIAHTHPIAQDGGLPKGWEFYEQYDKVMMDRCDSMIVLRLPGWETSVGVQAEIKYMEAQGKMIEYTDP